MRFREFNTRLNEGLPSVVDASHAALAANSTVGGTNMSSTPPVTGGNVATVPTTPVVATTTPGAQQQTPQAMPNFANGQMLKLKNGNAVQNMRVSKFDPSKNEITLTSTDGNPTTSVYNVNDIANSLVT